MIPMCCPPATLSRKMMVQPAHLTGLKLPSVPLAATDGSNVDLSRPFRPHRRLHLSRAPACPGQAPPDGWDAIPGARGCTPQSCSFRDHLAELRALGVAHVLGLSTQDSAYQNEAVERLKLPFPILSDSGLALAVVIKLPTFHARRHGSAQAHGAGD